MTAKVGRPDIYRAGAYILRMLHSSTIPWTFLPPSLSPSEQDHRESDMDGIWLRDFKPRPGATDTSREAESGSDDDDSEINSSAEDESDYGESDDDDDSANEKAVQAIRGAFAALAVEGDDSSEDEEGGDSSEPDADSEAEDSE